MEKKKVLSEEHKRNISIAGIGRIVSKETRQKLRDINLGKTLSDETRRKISQNHRRSQTEETRRKISQNHRRSQTEETRRKISIGSIGKKLSTITKEKLRIAHLGKKHTKEQIENRRIMMIGKRCGEKCNFWKGGITYLNRAIRNQFKYKQWVATCMARDNWTCGTCHTRGGILHVHHIEGFAELLKLYNIRTVEDALKCAPLWDLKNGITLCKECHKLTETYLKNNKVNNKPLLIYQTLVCERREKEK